MSDRVGLLAATICRWQDACALRANVHNNIALSYSFFVCYFFFASTLPKISGLSRFVEIVIWRKRHDLTELNLSGKISMELYMFTFCGGIFWFPGIKFCCEAPALEFSKCESSFQRRSTHPDISQQYWSSSNDALFCGSTFAQRRSLHRRRRLSQPAES
jgi:hypothetical protein